MRLYYIDESEGPRYYVRTALGVDAERWNALHQRVLDWRLELRDRYAVPTDRELHACDLLAGRGKLAHDGNTDRRLTPEQGVEIFTGGLRVIEDAARTIGGVEVVNVCLRKPDVRGYERASLDRLLNRINTSVAAANRHAFLIFDEGREEMVTRLYSRLRSRKPRPQQVRGMGGRRTDQGHAHRERHRRPRLPQLPRRLSAPDGRPHRPRPPQAGGGAVAQGRAPGHRSGLRDP